MYEPDEFEWEATIRRVYREEVAAASTPDEPAPRVEAMARATERVLQMIEDGDLKPDVSEVITAALRKADDRDARIADAVLARLVQGQGAFEFADDDPMLDVVVKLGGGRRKPWGNVNEFDLGEMDRLRYKNMRDATDAYDEWRQTYSAALPAVRRFGTIRDARDAGAWDQS